MEENQVQQKKGFIYKLTHPNCEKYYIGSTLAKLSHRLSRHIYDFKKDRTCISKEILKFGPENCKMELIEEFSFNDRKELFKREGFYIRNNRDKVVNLRIAGRDHDEWINENKRRMLDQKKEYYRLNRDIIRKKALNNYQNKKEYYKKYREMNREKIKEYQKLYRINKI